MINFLNWLKLKEEDGGGGGDMGGDTGVAGDSGGGDMGDNDSSDQHTHSMGGLLGFPWLYSNYLTKKKKRKKKSKH